MPSKPATPKPVKQAKPAKQAKPTSEASQASQASQVSPSAMPTFNTFRQAVSERAPAQGDAYWEFADNPQYVEYLDSLRQEDVQKIWQEGLYEDSLERIKEAMKSVQDRFLMRKHALEMMVACALAQTNLVFLGPPGTAKSLMVRSFAESMGIRSQNVPIREEDTEAELVQKGKRDVHKRRRLFEYLLTRYTTPEELFGGTDIQVLLNGGVFCRRTAGMLPQAEIAFLDEIFKANSAILNSLLSLINERIFYNMGQAFRVNLAFVVGASNETPDEGELGALYDRFPIRVPCYPVPADKELAEKLISKGHEFECAARLGGTGHRIQRQACLNDIRLLSKVVLGGACGGSEAFERNTDFKENFLTMFLTIRRQYGVSDRTPGPILRVCRALALLDRDSQKGIQLSTRQLRAWGYVAAKFEELGELQHLVKSKIQMWGEKEQDLFDGM